jgi:hypothetical protein
MGDVSACTYAGLSSPAASGRLVLRCGRFRRSPTSAIRFANMDHDPGSLADMSALARRRATGAVAVGTSAIAWWPAFTLGAWGIVFFEQLMLLWAVSTAAFVVLTVGGTREPIPRYRVAALLVPSAWLVLALLTRTGQEGRLGVVAQVVGTVITIVGIPAMALLLLRVASPSVVEVRDRRDRLAASLAVLVVVVISYGAGALNAQFLTCHDFMISGNSEPPGCNPGAPTLGSSNERSAAIRP